MVAVPDAVPDVVPDDSGIGSVAVVESRVEASSGEVAVSCRKLMDVVKGRIKRGGSAGGVMVCGTIGLAAVFPAGLAVCVEDVGAESFCFFGWAR